MRRTWAKCVCAALCLLTLTVGIWGAIGCTVWYYAGGDAGEFAGTELYRRQLERDLEWVYEMLDLLQGRSPDELDGNDRLWLRSLQEELDPSATNFRYRCTTPDGTVALSNVTGEDWPDRLERLYAREDIVDMWRGGDAADSGDTEGPVERADPNTVTYRIEYGVLDPLEVSGDRYTAALAWYTPMHEHMPKLAVYCAVCCAAGLLLLGLLLHAAGRRQDRPGAMLNWLDRIPYDLFVPLLIILGSIGCVLIDEALFAFQGALSPAPLALAAAMAVGVTAVGLALLLSTATRVKTRTLLRNTVIFRLGRAIGRAVVRAAGEVYRGVPMTWRAVALFVLYLLGTLLTGITVVLIPFYQGLVLFLICRWVLQWKQIRAATGQIVAGHSEVTIDAGKFYPDLREHAGQLNDLGSAIDHAVDERMKSERFKAELITNVSHDLKTPLTSIINYVDLLKKEDLPDPKVREYLDVLDRKSQRLKKLTEDLVEASKASTGALAVEPERLDLVQLVRQALGEYEEKLTAADLSLVPTLPEGPVAIWADGRHVWRVLDNLLGNCAKYALSGTRVYVDVQTWEANAVLTVKNISRQGLNIPPEQLLERFVRGDESRTTDGSGLGLSIARSLTELQGGRFSLAIDGDLFKAIVLLPLASGDIPPAAPEIPPAAL